MGSFVKAVTFTLEREGVFSNDRADTAGKTKYGVTEKELRALQKQGLYAGVRIEDLTIQQAKAVYKKFYWRYDDVKSDMVATKLFDIGVNMGVNTAVILLQEAVNFVGGGEHVAVDGQWGSQTLTAVNLLCLITSEALKLYNALTLFQAQRYVNIVLRNHSQIVFIQGWLSRAATRPPA